MKRLTDEEKTEIIAKYKTGNYTCNQLGREYGVKNGTISAMFKAMKIDVVFNISKFARKYSLNENFLDLIDTEEKAYFLGFMYADGCNHAKRNRFSISLQEEDSELLTKFSNLLDSNKPLHYTDRKTCVIKGIEYLQKRQVSLWIISKSLTDRLSELGCTPNKTFTIQFPTDNQVPSHLIRHFIRGYFDGDGSFSYNVSKKGWIRITVGLVGTVDFCEHIRDILSTKINVNSKVYQKVKYTNTTRELQTGGRIQGYKLLSWLYHDSTISLKRKYDKFILLENLLKNR